MKILEKYGIVMKNESLYKIALTHSSYSNEHESENYERLEFLGDAVLQLIISDYYYNNSDYLEGDMSKKRASFVCEAALATYSKDLGLDQLIRVGKGQSDNVNDTIVADVFESFLGAIYLDQGFNVAKSFIDQFVIPYIENEQHFFGDYKSLLQEMVQTDKKSLEYVLLKEEGPAHDKIFTVGVKIDDMIYGTGVGRSKKDAEQKAAYSAYMKRAK